MISEQLAERSKRIIIISQIYMLAQISLSIQQLANHNDLKNLLLYIPLSLVWLWFAVMGYLNIKMIKKIYEAQNQEMYMPINNSIKLIISLINTDENCLLNWCCICFLALYIYVQSILTNIFELDWYEYYTFAQATILIIGSQAFRYFFNQPFPLYKINSFINELNSALYFIKFMVVLTFLRISYFLYHASNGRLVNELIAATVLAESSLILISIWNMYKELTMLNLDHMIHDNHPCFNGWFTILRSIFNQQKYHCYESLLVIIFVMQALIVTFENEEHDDMNEGEVNRHYYIFAESILILIQVLDKGTSYFIWKMFSYCNLYPYILCFQTPEHPYIPIHPQKQFNNISQQELLTIINEQESKDCSICLQPMENDLVNLTCHKLHIFHKECIEAWLHQHQFCPLCRKII